VELSGRTIGKVFFALTSRFVQIKSFLALLAFSISIARVAVLNCAGDRAGPKRVG